MSNNLSALKLTKGKCVYRISYTTFTYFFSPSSKRKGSNDSGAFIFDFKTHKFKERRAVFFPFSASLVHNFVKYVMYFSPTLLQLQQILRTRSPMPKSVPECITLSLPANFEERALSSSANAEDFRLNFRFFSLFSPVSFSFFRFLIFF